MLTILIILSVWNLIVFFVYGWDKLCAKKGKRRIKERVLLMCAFLLGSWGAMFGMVVFNHKTSKIKFRLLVPLFIIFHIISACLIIGVNL